MYEKLGSKLKGLWVAASLISLALPIFAAQFDLSRAAFGRIIEVEMICLLALALPSSLFIVPLLVAFKMVIELDYNQIEGAYFYIILLNIIGYIQWFRLMPTFFGKAKPLKFDSILND